MTVHTTNFRGVDMSRIERREERREQWRKLGKSMAMGNKDALVAVLDLLIAPRNPIWERISDIAIGYVVDAILDGREEVLEGVKEALDQVEG